MKNLSSHLRPYRWNILLAVLAMGISAGSDLGLPLLLAQIVNVGLYQDDLAVVLRLGGWMLALALLGGGFALLNSYLSRWEHWRFPSEPAPPFLWFFVFLFLCSLFPFRLWRKKGSRFPPRCRSGLTASPSLCEKS